VRVTGQELHAHSMPTAQCKAKAVVDVIAPFLTALFKASLSSGFFLEAFEAAYITRS